MSRCIFSTGDNHVLYKNIVCRDPGVCPAGLSDLGISVLGSTKMFHVKQTRPASPTWRD